MINIRFDPIEVDEAIEILFARVLNKFHGECDLISYRNNIIDWKGWKENHVIKSNYIWFCDGLAMASFGMDLLFCFVIIDFC